MAKKSKSSSRSAPARPKGRTEPVYTVMVFVTFLAMLIGCALLYLDYDEYGQKSPPKESPPSLPKLGSEDLKGKGGATAPGNT
jgi:hypothetical protein